MAGATAVYEESNKTLDENVPLHGADSPGASLGSGVVWTAKTPWGDADGELGPRVALVTANGSGATITGAGNGLSADRTDVDQFKAHVNPVVRVPSPGPAGSRFVAQWQWEAVVSEMLEDGVVCELHDLTDPSMPYEVAELGFNKFHREDKPLLEPGAVIYLSVGYEIKEKGQIVDQERVRVRRSASWSARRLKAAKKRAAERRRALSERE